MRWFKHFSDARHNPKFRAIEKKLGEAGYARAFKLFEMVSGLGASGTKFSPTIDLRRPPTDLDWLADEWKISNDEAMTTLSTFAEVRLIDPNNWRKRIVYVPQMLEYLDEWTQRRKRDKDSRVTPEPLGRNTGELRLESESELEVEEESESVMTDRRDRLFLKGEIWEELDVKNLPRKYKNFVLLVEANPHNKAEDFVTWCRCILHLCGERGIEYPKVFLKRIGDAERNGHAADILRIPGHRIPTVKDIRPEH